MANIRKPPTHGPQHAPRFYLICIAVMAVLVMGGMIVAQQSCALRRFRDASQHSSDKCWMSASVPSDGWDSLDAQESLAIQRVMYSDVLWHRVNKMKVEAEDWDELLKASSLFDPRDFRLRAVLKLVKSYLEPWRPIPGVTQGFGAGVKAWNVANVREAAVNSNVMSCCLHVRVVDGVVYFRYGQVVSLDWKLNRGNDFISFLQLVIDEFRLSSLKVEFFFNTCAHALGNSAAFSAVSELSNRANFLVFSNHLTDMNTDFLVPDFLDLGARYMPTQAELARRKSKWQDRLSKLVFRGATTNYILQLFNWGSNPRIKAHRMTDAYPDLMDARLSRWSHTTPGIVWHLRRDLIDLAPAFNFTQKGVFKYELVADGGLGNTRVCGVMASDRVMVRQSSPFFQFFDPLLKRNRHFVEVKHNLQDLADVVTYMQHHDQEMEKMVKVAREELGWTCSLKGRQLAWAVALVKYQSLLQDKHLVEKPTQFCKWGAAREPFDYPKNVELDCIDTEKTPILEMSGCPSMCASYGLHEKDWFWLSSKDLEGWRSWNMTF